MRRQYSNVRGFTLIELMIVVTIVGVLSALAIYGVRRYILNAKTAEARNSVGQIAKDAKTAYERESMDGNLQAPATLTRVVNNFCQDAETPVPDSVQKVAGAKYQSSASDWRGTGNAKVGFTCLRFAMSDPQYFMYDYKGTPGSAGTFMAAAYGDLNGDSLTSSFILRGNVAGGTVFVSPTFDETDPEE